MATPQEFNIAVKESLDILYSDGLGPGGYTSPVQTMDDLIGRGLLDEQGNATSKGVLFTTLQEAGAIDEQGVLTEKGRAYSMTDDEWSKPENLPAFKQRWEDGIQRPTAEWDQILTETKNWAGRAAGGTVERIGQELETLWHNSKRWDSFFGQADNRPPELVERMNASGMGIVEGASENLAQLGSLADIGAAWVGDQILQFTDMEQSADEALWLARQRQAALQADIQSLKAGDLAEQIGAVENAAQVVEKAKKTLGEQEFKDIYERGSAAGEFIGDPTNILAAGIATKAATSASIFTRMGLKAEQAIAKRVGMEMAVAETRTALAAAQSGAMKTGNAAQLASKLATDLGNRSKILSDPALIKRAEQAQAIAARTAEQAEEFAAAIPQLESRLGDLTAKAEKFSSKLPASIAEKYQKAVQVGRAVRAAPVNVIGGSLERIGSTMTRIDDTLKGFLDERGMTGLYSGAVGAAGMVGLAGNPVVGMIGAGAAALKTGKMINNAGKFFKYVGQEMMQARGQVPFWQRVAAHSEKSATHRALAHTLDAMTLGGVVPDVINRTARGVGAAYPVDLAFEYLGDGADMRPETFKQALAESLVIGGSFAAAGGAFMGSKQRHKELAIGDELNFREMLEGDQKALFAAIPGQARRAIATYSIANPTLKWRFTNNGGSNYDPNSNTAFINVASTNPMKALVAHEVLHHVAIKNQIEGQIAALFLGDTKENTVGGLLRSKDGTLDPAFAEFVETYNRRMDNAGLKRPTMDEMAVEYFIEMHADQYANQAESGALGQSASRTAARRWMGDVLNTVLPKVPVLRDLHMKMGGQIDRNGSTVDGNGLLADGIRQLPEAQRMFRDMNRRSAGRPPGQFEPLGSDKETGGAQLTLDPTNPIDVGLLHPLIAVDADGNPILGKDGKPVAVDKATDVLRGNAGLTVMEKLRQYQGEGRRYAPGEMHLDTNGEVVGAWLNDDTLRAVINQNKFNKEQAAILRSVNSTLKTGDGNRMVVINFPATEKTRSGKVIYATKQATIRDVVPVALTVTKDGNLLIGLMSVTKLHENIRKRAGTRRGKKLYAGNYDAILEDVHAMMEHHKKGIDSIAHFEKKYGAVEALERKRFINTMFGLMNKTEQAALNPLLLEDGVTSKDNVYRTYRVDRVSKAVPLNPDEHKAMPFNYEAAKQVRMPENKANFLPDGVPDVQASQNARRVKSGIKIGNQIFNRGNPAPPDLAFSAARQLGREPATFGNILSAAGHPNWPDTVPGALEYRDSLSFGIQQLKEKQSKQETANERQIVSDLGVTMDQALDAAFDTTSYTLASTAKIGIRNLVFRGEDAPPTFQEASLAGGDVSRISGSIYPVVRVRLSNGSEFFEKIRISDHAQVSSNAPRHYEYDYRFKSEKETFRSNEFKSDMEALGADIWERQRAAIEQLKNNSPTRAANAADMQSRETVPGSESRQSLGQSQSQSSRGASRF